MTLKEKIQKDIIDASKEKNELKSSTLKLVMAAAKNKEIEKRGKFARFNPGETQENLAKLSELNDEELGHVLGIELKKRKDAAELYKKGGRTDLAEKEEKEMAILKVYLPEELSEEEVKKIIAQAVEKSKSAGAGNFGSVMKEASAQIKGRADGGFVAKLVKEAMQEQNA